MSSPARHPLDALPHRGVIPVSVVDGLPMPALVSRLSDDTVVRMNPEFAAAYGYHSRDVEGLPTRRLHAEEEDRRRTLDLHADGHLESVDVRVRSASGESRWAQVDVSRFSLDGVEDVLLTTFYDIEARKEAEERAREREALIAEMALFPEMNPGPVVRLDPDGTVRRSNAAARSLFGETLEGRCFWDLCPGFSEPVRERALESTEPVQEDVQVGAVWLRFTLVRAQDRRQIFVYGSDITSQKTAERELAERARFPAMNPGPVARLASDATVIRANPAASHLFGLDSIQGMSWLELCPGIDERLWTRARNDDDLVLYEADIGGRCFTFTLRHEPIADQVFAYGADITELKSAERALAELARFPDMNPGPVCRLDRDGRILLANPAARAVFRSDDLTGQSWLTLVPAAGGDFWARVLTSGETAALEAKIADRHFMLTHAPGPEGVFIFVYGSDVTREKEAERVLRQSEKMATLGTLAAGVAHELNNPAAAAQRAAEQLERSFAALQTARVALSAAQADDGADDLVTELEASAREAAACPCELDPLARSDLEADVEEWLEEHGAEAPWEIASTLVEGGFDLPRLEALAGRAGHHSVGLVVTWHAHTHRVYRLLEEIRQGTARLSEIVGAMKAYSYLGQAPIQSIDINEGIRNTLVILRSKLKEGIVVRQELDPDLPRIEAYGGELNQVWTNLLDNAADAMGGRGEIRLRSSVAREHVVVEVEDDGPGIPDDAQSRVFDAFFTTKPPGKGTGLGLNTSYKIVVEKHGGSIRVESVPGRTRFTVELPVRRPTNLDEPAEQPRTTESST